jgi:signal transduction histidine kinase/FixJ family two-component response regulator
MSKKILIIDDHEEIRTAVEYLLENANKDYTVFKAGTADKGLNLIKKNPDIQVILLDIIMPAKNGKQVLHELKDKIENLRIIVLTGFPGNFTADEAKKSGVFHYLSKPPDEEPLIFAIESAFNDIRIKELQKKSDIFRDIARLLIDFHDLQRVLDFIAEKSLELLKGYTCHIRTVEEETRSLILRSGKGPYMTIADKRRKIGDLISGKVAQEGKTKVINQLQEEKYFKKLKEMYLEKEGSNAEMKEYLKSAKSAIVVPIKREKKVIGIINMTSDKEKYFVKSVKETLENFADQVSIAITISETQKKSIEDEKFSSLGRVMGDLAHVIESEAAKIRFKGMDILPQFPESNPKRRILQSILDRAQYLIDTKRNISSPFTDVHPEKIPIEMLTREIRRLLENMEREFNNEQIEYKIDFAGVLSPVYGDIARLIKVFDHLIKNSYEAMKNKGGNLRITASTDESNEFLNIIFEDSGKGVKEQYKQKLFASFFSTKQGGLGYGLWYCKQTMLNMKGDVFLLDSSKNKGVTFCVKIPLYKKEE